jgi:hypothetical protein
MARYKIECCRDCPDRFPGCHGQCEKYRKERAEYDETMAEKKKEIDVKNGLDGFLYNSIERTNRQINYRSKFRRKR